MTKRDIFVDNYRPQDWSAQEQLVALHETHGMTGETLHAWCREHGVFPHHLAEWQAAFCTDKKSGPLDSKALRVLKEDNDRLQREVLRKDKALAEAAALLILQKKVPGALGGRGQMTALPERIEVMAMVAEAVKAGARQDMACAATRGRRACRRPRTGSARLNAVSCSLLPTPMSSRAFRPVRSCHAWSIKGCTWRRSRHSIEC